MVEKKGKNEKKKKIGQKNVFRNAIFKETCKNAIITINRQRVRIELYTAFVCLVMEYLYIKY